MGQQYLRNLSVIVADDTGQGIDLASSQGATGPLRVVFNIERGDLQNPNTADVRVYNLSKQTAQRIYELEFTQIAMQTSYGSDPLALIFAGSIIQARKGREDQKNSYVAITAADGDEAYNFAWVSFSLPAGMTAGNDLTKLISGMQGLAKSPPTLGYVPPGMNPNPRVRGKVFFGMVRDELRKWAITNDCIWSIQDGKVVMIPSTSYIPSGTVPVISPLTGLLGVPEQTQNGLSMRVLLNPIIRIGQIVELNSSNVNQYRYGLDVDSQAEIAMLQASVEKLNADGLYYVMRADHHGDTRGEQWETELTCLAVDATSPATVTYNPVTGYTGEGPIKPQ